jgi:hypothetical protein
VKPISPVSNLINCLTNDEDKRQELWLHYLSGNDPSTLASHLEKMEQSYTLDSELQSLLWDIFSNPPSDKFKVLLSHFSEVEQSVVCLLALGLTVHQVSRYKGISEIRIKQVVSIIRENDCWEELYGIKKEAHG